MLIFSGVLALPRGDCRVGVFAGLDGVIERPAGLHGRWSGFRSFPFESVFVVVVNGEFARVDRRLDESDELLSLLVGTGIRVDGGTTADAFGEFIFRNDGLTPFMVLTVEYAKSL